jgi:hypothetical protein|nr:MAG TPA: hypothetical protein [Caudoviricetes sp.]
MSAEAGLLAGVYYDTLDNVAYDPADEQTKDTIN